MTDTATHSPSDTPKKEDPYVDICRALQPGILLTINDSDPSQPGIDEMEVTHVDEKTGELTLEGHGGRVFTIRHNDQHYDGPAIKEVSDSEFSRIHEPVITIEIIGIA